MHFASSFKANLVAAISIALTCADQLTAIPLGPPGLNLHEFRNTAQQRLEDGLELSLALPSGQQDYRTLPTDLIPQQNPEPSANHLERYQTQRLQQYSQPTYGQAPAPHLVDWHGPLADGGRNAHHASQQAQATQYSLDQASMLGQSGLQQTQVTVPHWLRNPMGSVEQRRMPAVPGSGSAHHTGPQPQVSRLEFPDDWQSKTRRQKQQWLVDQGESMFTRESLWARPMVLATNSHVAGATDKERDLISEIIKMKGDSVTTRWNKNYVPTAKDMKKIMDIVTKIRKRPEQDKVDGPFDSEWLSSSSASGILDKFRLGDYLIVFGRNPGRSGKTKTYLAEKGELTAYPEAFLLRADTKSKKLARIHLGQIDIVSHSDDELKIQTMKPTPPKANRVKKTGQTSASRG